MWNADYVENLTQESLEKYCNNFEHQNPELYQYLKSTIEEAAEKGNYSTDIIPLSTNDVSIQEIQKYLQIKGFNVYLRDTLIDSFSSLTHDSTEGKIKNSLKVNW